MWCMVLMVIAYIYLPLSVSALTHGSCKTLNDDGDRQMDSDYAMIIRDLKSDNNLLSI
jgi:hypothetical protein